MTTLRPHISALIVTAALIAQGCSASTGALRARRLLSRGDYERAAATLAKARREEPSDRELLGLNLRLHYAQGKAKETAALYSRHPSKNLRKRYAIAAIWAAMRHEEPEIRLAGVHAARRGDVEELLKDMARRLSDPDGKVRSWAAVALSNLPAGADVLEKQLRAPDPAARAIAVAEVGRIAKDKAFDAVVRFVKDPKPEPRAAAARALAFTGRKQALPLVATLTNDKDRRVRLAAVTALGRLGFAGGRQAARRRLKDDYLPIRMAALAAYAKLAGDDALTYLKEAAAGADPRVALHAGRLLAQRKTLQPVLDAIAKALVDKRWSVRVSGITTASMINDKVAWALATKGLRDPEPAVRLAAVRLLRARKLKAKEGDRAAEALFALLCEPKVETGSAFARCVEAAELLAQRNNNRGKAQLLQMVKTGPTWQNRATALRAALRHDPAAEVALAGLADVEPRVNLIAATYLYRKLR